MLTYLVPSGLELWILSGVTRGDILGDSPKPCGWSTHSLYLLPLAKFGANAILGVSLAVCKAGAAEKVVAVQGTLKSLLQHHNSKASILQHSAFFMVQLSHLYVTTGKITAFTIWTWWYHFVGKMISLLFNLLSGCT